MNNDKRAPDRAKTAANERRVLEVARHHYNKSRKRRAGDSVQVRVISPPLMMMPGSPPQLKVGTPSIRECECTCQRPCPRTPCNNIIQNSSEVKLRPLPSLVNQTQRQTHPCVRIQRNREVAENYMTTASAWTLPTPTMRDHHRCGRSHTCVSKDERCCSLDRPQMLPLGKSLV